MRDAKKQEKQWRYRTNWRGKVIVQVGEMQPYNFNPEYDTKPGGYSIQWRDANVQDLTATMPMTAIAGESE